MRTKRVKENSKEETTKFNVNFLAEPQRVNVDSKRKTMRFKVNSKQEPPERVKGKP